MDCIKRGLIDPFADPKKEPLLNHLQAFSNHLAADENTPEYIKRTMKRITDVFMACGFKAIDDLTRYDARAKVADCLKALRDGGLSNASSNHYLTAIKNFLNWAAKDSRMPQSPILLLEKLSTATDEKRERRALTTDEFAKLIEKARKGKPPTDRRATGVALHDGCLQRVVGIGTRQLDAREFPFCRPAVYQGGSTRHQKQATHGPADTQRLRQDDTALGGGARGAFMVASSLCPVCRNVAGRPCQSQDSRGN